MIIYNYGRQQKKSWCELEVFYEFVERPKLPIDLDSVQRWVPLNDIDRVVRCTLSGGRERPDR